MASQETTQTAAERSLRIGEVARLVGTTPRTIRYYEEIGLLQRDPARLAGGHRTYGQQEVERLQEIIRLKELLGISLEDLRELVRTREAGAALRQELQREDLSPARRRAALGEAQKLLDRQLELVERRLGELERLKLELVERRQRVDRLLAELEQGRPAASRR